MEALAIGDRVTCPLHPVGFVSATHAAPMALLQTCAVLCLGHLEADLGKCFRSLLEYRTLS